MGLISRVSSRTYRKKKQTNMKLITHNFLQSIVKGVTKPYPLLIKSTETDAFEVDFSEENVKSMISRLEYPALLSALKDISYNHSLPEKLPENIESLGDDLVKQLHHILFEVEVMEGCLVCPESGREFPITRGIPNMLLTEEEV